MKKKILNIRIDEDLSNKFKNYCKKNGYSISKRIRVLIKKDMDEK